MLNYLLPVSLGIEAILLVLVLYLLIRYKRLYRAYDTFMRGKDAETLEDTIVQMGDELRDLRSEDRANKDAIRVLNKNQRASLQKFGVVRYNAFKEMGGNLSFTLCLLDDVNTGFILNTMHGRDSSYTYIKEIIKGEAYATLGEEEKEALEKAINS